MILSRRVLRGSAAAATATRGRCVAVGDARPAEVRDPDHRADAVRHDRARRRAAGGRAPRLTAARWGDTLIGMAAPGLVKDSYRVGVAVVRVLGDSTKTHEIHRVEEITGGRGYRRLLAELRRTPEGQAPARRAPRAVERPRRLRPPARPCPQTHARRRLRAAPRRQQLTADYQAAATRHVDDPDMAYLMRRFRQTHDVWHALLGIGVTGHEEVLMHWFSYGQLRLPVSAMIMVFGTMKHIVLERAGARCATRCSRRIARAATPQPLLPVYWEDLGGSGRSTTCARGTACTPLDRSSSPELRWARTTRTHGATRARAGRRGSSCAIASNSRRSRPAARASVRSPSTRRPCRGARHTRCRVRSARAAYAHRRTPRSRHRAARRRRQLRDVRRRRQLWFALVVDEPN